MNIDKSLKKLTIIFFFGFVFIVPIVTFATPDKTISEIENKILTQLPTLNMDTIKDKSFMNNFDKYTSDQFPMREEFIKLKNSYSYVLGNKEFRDIYISKDNRLMEKFIFNEELINKNISKVSTMATYLYDNYNINSTLMTIPTSIAFYGDDLPGFAIYDNQVDALNYIDKELSKLGSISSSNDKYSFIDFYTPYDALYKYKDMPIYFNTDHHWTQLGARIAYEDMYGLKNPSTDLLYNNYNEVSNDFYGTYYSKALLPQIKGDSIYAYGDFNEFDISIDFDKEFNTLYGEDKLEGKNKYQYFLHGDPAFAVIEGNVDSRDEILIFKDSYAHSFVPFLTSNYRKIHIVDPRYYNIDIDDYLSENKEINEVLFMHNIQTFNSMDIYKSF